MVLRRNSETELSVDENSYFMRQNCTHYHYLSTQYSVGE